MGSFLLRSLARPSLNIDLSLRMPAKCIVPRDSLNHRYLDKRALYTGHLARAALDREGSVGKLVDKVEVVCIDRPGWVCMHSSDFIFLSSYWSIKRIRLL